MYTAEKTKKPKQDLFASSMLFVLSKLKYVYNGRYR